MCCYGNMFDDDCASLVFLRSAMVVYPCDINKKSRLLTGKKGQLKKEVPSVAVMTNFGSNHPLMPQSWGKQIRVVGCHVQVCRECTCYITNGGESLHNAYKTIPKHPPPPHHGVAEERTWGCHVKVCRERTCYKTNCGESLHSSLYRCEVPLPIKSKNPQTLPLKSWGGGGIAKGVWVPCLSL